jgi:hypothetical protein
MSLEIVLKATHHIRAMGRGSRAHLMQCENGALCVVKLGRRTRRPELMSGFVASRIARALGLPTPEWVVVEVSNLLLEEASDPARAREACPAERTSLHPATCYAGSQDGAVFDLLPDSYLSRLNNRESFLHFLALDQWCSHPGPPRPLFHLSGSQYSAEFMVRGGSFCGGKTGIRDDARNGVYYQKAVYSHVTGWDSFDPFLSNLILTSPDDLHRATHDLPFGWSDEYAIELDSLVESLLQRRSRIRQLVAQARDQVPDLFPNWMRRAFVPVQQRADASPLLRLIRSGI